MENIQPIMKVSVIGSGCIGVFCSGLFHHYFKDEVILFGRKNGETEVTLNKNPLIKITNFNSLKNGLEIPLSKAFRFETELSKDNLEDSDIILICVETFETENVCKQLVGRIKKEACIISLQNGLDNGEKIKSILTEQYVLPSVVFFNVVRKPNEKSLHFHNGTNDRLLNISCTPINDKRDLPKEYLKWISSRSIKDVIEVNSISNIQANQYHKLIFNLNGSINLLSGKTILETLVIYNH